MFIACALALIVWRQAIAETHYPRAAKVKDCTYPPLEVEANLAHSVISFQFNHCLIATASLSEITDWYANKYANKSVTPLGINLEYNKWENGLFGITTAHHIYFMPPDCLIKQIAPCVSTTPSDTGISTGIFSWTSIVLYRP
jgi:hypothetical protein